MRIAAGVLAAVLAASALAVAEDEKETGKAYLFSVEDQKHTNISFSSETEIETIDGLTHVAGGRTWLDFENLKGKCDIKVPVEHMKTGIDLRDEHMRSETWLDAKKFPEITLTSDGFDLVAKNKDKGIYSAKFKGKLTIHGVTKDLETTAKVVKMTKEQGDMMGDGEWVHVVASFDVTLKDFDVVIPKGAVVAKVSPTWTVKFDCYGSTVEQKAK